MIDVLHTRRETLGGILALFWPKCPAACPALCYTVRAFVTLAIPVDTHRP